ncbi:alpha/beta hydrolase [Parabacteroides sp. OttesenSCG-928-K15]|nr:alpha/beta hydrolase [Parabacteroides sp. OttesenSCG-928-K15]
MTHDSHYREDLLKNGFEQLLIPLADDYEGSASATLVRRKTETGSGKAVLYVHGFNDYFFQEEMAYRFNQQGYHFYAIDLRKYGRSYLPHQKFNDIRDLKTYYEEIDKALAIIHVEHNNRVILLGHSTGGLILTLYAKDHPDSRFFDGLILNSPFYVLNKSRFVRMLLPLVSLIGGLFPTITIAGGFSEEYGKSIHRSFDGEWDYNLAWKPHLAPKVNVGWLRAIYQGQKELKTPFPIDKPVLVLHSDKSVHDFSAMRQLHTRDAILNIKDIDRIARHIVGNVEITTIEGGLHDLFLSARPVREKVYASLFSWLGRMYGDISN